MYGEIDVMDATPPLPRVSFKFYQEYFIWALVHYSNCLFIFETYLLGI